MIKDTTFAKKNTVFCERNTDISEIKKDLVLKGIFSGTACVCVYLCTNFQASSLILMSLGLTSCYVLHMRSINLDDGYKTRVVFLDISKAFDNVSNEGLPHKLKENNISGKFQNTVKDFIYQRKKSVVLNGQYSSWAVVEEEVLQGSILRTYTYTIYLIF